MAFFIWKLPFIKLKHPILKVLLLAICFVSVSCSEKPQDSETKYRKVIEMVKNNDQLFKDVPHIDIDELQKLDPDTYQLIDTREAKERKVSWIPNSITLAAFEKNPKAYEGKLLIAYCTIGYRSALHTKALNQKKFTAKNLRGSMLLWAWNDLPLENKDGKTNKLHVYGNRWNLLPSNYLGVVD